MTGTRHGLRLGWPRHALAPQQPFISTPVLFRIEVTAPDNPLRQSGHRRYRHNCKV